MRKRSYSLPTRHTLRRSPLKKTSSSSPGPKKSKKSTIFIKRYKKLIKPIGRGGYGTVFRAKLKQPPYTDRVVKVINKKLIRKPDILLNEVNILRQVDHPNIVKLYESFEDKSYLYLVTE